VAASISFHLRSVWQIERTCGIISTVNDGSEVMSPAERISGALDDIIKDTEVESFHILFHALTTVVQSADLTSQTERRAHEKYTLDTSKR
jgi:hypothetical protein